VGQLLGVGLHFAGGFVQQRGPLDGGGALPAGEGGLGGGDGRLDVNGRTQRHRV